MVCSRCTFDGFPIERFRSLEEKWQEEPIDDREGPSRRRKRRAQGDGVGGAIDDDGVVFVAAVVAVMNLYRRRRKPFAERAIVSAMDSPMCHPTVDFTSPLPPTIGPSITFQWRRWKHPNIPEGTNRDYCSQQPKKKQGRSGLAVGHGATRRATHPPSKWSVSIRLPNSHTTPNRQPSSVPALPGAPTVNHCPHLPKPPRSSFCRALSFLLNKSRSRRVEIDAKGGSPYKT